MKFPKIQTLKQIAEIIDAKYIGADDFPISGTNEIHRVKSGEIVFVNHPKYYEKALNSEATVILIDKEVDCPQGKALLVSDDPFRDFNKINAHFTPIQTFKTYGENVKIGKNSQVHSSVIIGNDVEIGEECIIMPNVVIGDRTKIGNRCIIQSGTVLGGDAFYYRKLPRGYIMLLSVGIVVLVDDVERGANCTIDRGVTDTTIVGEGTKMDNQIQIGHDTIIGKRCLIASQVGIAGCCNIGNDVTIWGQVGVSSDITVEDEVVILATSGVSKDLKKGKTYFGAPAEEAKEYYKKQVKITRLIQG